MARKKSIEEQVKDGLKKLAFGSVTDPISLLFIDEQSIIDKLPKLNLINVSEIKRPKGGGMEIKFFDRIKALEKLSEMTATKSDEGLSFYEALEKSVEKAKGVKKEDD